MIYESDYRKRERKKKEKVALGWQKWFAWYPVKIGENKKTGNSMMAWLCFVDRKFHYNTSHLDIQGSTSYYEYRKRKNKERK